MSKALNDTTLLELIPHSISNDTAVQDMARALQPDIDVINESIPLIELYSRLDELPDGILHMLAWENKMGGPEWGLTITREDKINLIRNSYELNKRRGTRWSIEKVFELLRFKPEIVEWWEDGAPPYSFKIRVLDVAERGLTLDQVKLIDQLIYMYKPLRAWLSYLGITLTSEAAPKALAAITQYGVMDVGPMPYGAEFVDFNYDAKTPAAITLTGVLSLGSMPFIEETSNNEFDFGAQRAITGNAVIDVGPRLDTGKNEATVTQGVASHLTVKFRRD